jgi:thiamine biosynthesis lipoprotein
MKTARIILVLALLPAALLANEFTRARYLMGTTCEVSVPASERADEQIKAAFDEASRIEAMLSTWRDDSELARVNRGATPSRELHAVLLETIAYAHTTNGAFNPLIRPLIDAWGTRGTAHVPTDEAKRAAIAATSLDNVDGTTLKNGAKFEEGAWGKGYAIDRMLDAIRARGAASARINFGGQLGAFGYAITVSIADPAQRNIAFADLTLDNESISTSSGSEKTFVVNGRSVTHIIDPRSGNALPPRGSVSVIHKSALTADILSTALYVMGAEEGVEWARKHDITAIFITPDRALISSSPGHGLTIRKKD